MADLVGFEITPLRMGLDSFFFERGTSEACFLRWKVIAGMGVMPLPLPGEPGNWGMEQGGK